MSRLYFVALVPCEPVLGEVREIKQYCSEHFHSKHALRSPAHITLYPPFKSDDIKLEHCGTALSEIAASRTRFDVEVKGFDCFKPRVIFVKPVKSPEMLALQSEVWLRLNGIIKPKKVDQRPFHPHMTIAFRDLTKSNFHRAWEYFEKKEYRRMWTARDICLLMHGDEGWSVLRRFDFG